MVLSKGLTEGKQGLCSRLVALRVSFCLLVGIAPGWITTHLRPCSALESWSNWASWWIHGALIRLAQAKHKHKALSGMLFSVAAHSWGNPSLCECLAMCLLPTLFMSLSLFGTFRRDAAFIHLVPMCLTCQSKVLSTKQDVDTYLWYFSPIWRINTN